MRYEACIRNLSFKQAQALYRFLVDINDDMYGCEGSTWSGIMPSKTRRSSEDRIITIQPMIGEDDA